MNVRAEMARRGVSQSALGAAIGMSQTALSRRLSAKTSFSVEQILAIARHLDTSIVELIDTTPEDATSSVRDRKAAS